jgi:hypothetical protein
MVTFLSELNGMELWAIDIGNAHLEAYTAEKLYIVAGPEFGELEGHMLIISKKLYGLRTSGLRCTIDFPSVSGRWVLNTVTPVRPNQTFGCIRLTIFMSTLLST